MFTSFLFAFLTSEEMWWGYTYRKSKIIFCLTLEDRKVNAVDFTSAFSLSMSRRFLSSMRLKYFPVVTWRSRKGWPHLMWLPLHLANTVQTWSKNVHNHRRNSTEVYVSDNEQGCFAYSPTYCCQTLYCVGSINLLSQITEWWFRMSR